MELERTPIDHWFCERGNPVVSQRIPSLTQGVLFVEFKDAYKAKEIMHGKKVAKRSEKTKCGSLDE